jgi:GntR family transcriptional regulator / MocR family aminotransferase
MTIFKDVPFHPALDRPLYQQLYTHMRTAILTGKLKGGLKLPSTRTLMTELGVSRTTVLNAYDQLSAEGYLETFPARGTFVAQVLPEHVFETSSRKRDKAQKTLSRPSQLSRHAEKQLAAPTLFVPQPLSDKLTNPFSTVNPTLDAHSYETWSRLVTRQVRRLAGRASKYQDAEGYPPLREAIAAHVTLSRQVRCTPEQIIIVAGSQGGLDLVARMLLNAGDEVWLEDPGYFGARGAFLGVGANIIPVPVDRKGLVVEAGLTRAPKAKLAYVTPSHQYPLGVTMSLPRRLALLEWARETPAYILEDDYDSEFRYVGRPLASLQGLDDADQVIYLGTFSKVLFQSLRIGYLILPPTLVESFTSVRRLVDIHSPLLEQAVLAEFISEGHYTRHLRRMRNHYAERRAALLEAVRELPLEMDSPDAGLHCIGWLPEGVDDKAVVRAAAKHGLELWPVSHSCIEPLERKGLMLGYGNPTQEALEDGIRRLSAALRKT